MQYLATAQQAKQIDEVSMNNIGIPSCVLMERAALKVADCICANIPAVQNKILVICGNGNNGGDGVAAGRILAERGYEVTIILPGEEERAGKGLLQQLEIARKLSLPVITSVTPEDFCSSSDIGSTETVIIDAIFGIGLSREISGKYQEWIQWINQSGNTVFSVDIPSGIHASSGNVLGLAVNADYTVTFGVNKLGMALYPGAEYAGTVFVEEIGFPKSVVKEIAADCFSLEKEDVLSYFPKRLPRSHKGTYGKLLVIAGSETISGAAYFSAKAAYLMGCGMVHVVSHENNRSMLQEKLPEALYTFYGGHSENTGFHKELRELILQASAVVIGPGIGTSSFAEKLLQIVIQEGIESEKLSVLIDADGLNLLSGMRQYFDGNKNLRLPKNFVITPHIKEMSRLLQTPVAEIQTKLPDAAKKTAEGAVIVLKDARTVISDGTKIALNQSGNNALAKGGSGDVLSGMIGGMLARGTDTFTAAVLGVYLHGLTAEEYVNGKSFSSMLASDILQYIPLVLP